MMLASEFTPTISKTPDSLRGILSSDALRSGTSSRNDSYIFGTKETTNRSKLTSFPLLTESSLSKKGSTSASQTFSPALPSVTTDAALHNRDLHRAEQRLQMLASMDMRDSFEAGNAPIPAAVRDAGILLRKFAALEAELILPDIGLDLDGTIVYSFHPDRNGLIGSLSVFGDGTYSFYLEKNGDFIESGAAKIAQPLDLNLQNLLLE
jgi:hypothetical protein